MDAVQFPGSTHAIPRRWSLSRGLLAAALGTGIAIGGSVRPATPSEAAPAAWQIDPGSQITDRHDQQVAHVLQPGSRGTAIDV